MNNFACLSVVDETCTTPNAFQEFTGTEYLMIDIASLFGLDKQNWKARIQWVSDNDACLEDLVKKAEKPAMYHAAVTAYRKAQQGLPTGHAISLDATSSGIQILAVMSGCEASARVSNVLPSSPTHDDREDAYANLYALMVDTPEQRLMVPKEDVKKSIMTAFYGSTATPKSRLPESVLKRFYEVLETETEGAWALNKFLESCWNPDTTCHSWLLPDNFHVEVPVEATVTNHVTFDGSTFDVHTKIKRASEYGKSLCPNIVHSVDGMITREMARRCSFDTEAIQKLKKDLDSPRAGASTGRAKDRLVQILWDNYRYSGFLSTRILQHIDHKNAMLVNKKTILKLIATLPAKPFPIMTIHDCFRCHPNYGNDLRRQYNQILSDLAKSDILHFIASLVQGKLVNLPPKTDFSEEILLSNYSLS